MYTWLYIHFHSDFFLLRPWDLICPSLCPHLLSSGSLFPAVCFCPSPFQAVCKEKAMRRMITVVTMIYYYSSTSVVLATCTLLTSARCMGYLLLSSFPFYRWGNGGSDVKQAAPWVTQLISDRAGVCTRVVWFQLLRFQHHGTL